MSKFLVEKKVNFLVLKTNKYLKIIIFKKYLKVYYKF